MQVGNHTSLNYCFPYRRSQEAVNFPVPGSIPQTGLDGATTLRIVSPGYSPTPPFRETAVDVPIFPPAGQLVVDHSHPDFLDILTWLVGADQVMRKDARQAARHRQGRSTVT